MATFDAAGGGNTGAINAASLTYSHTTTGTNLVLVVHVTTSGTVTSVTYSGTGMTQLGTTQTVGSGFLSLWIMTAPATGTNNVVVTCSASSIIASVSQSIASAQQTTSPIFNFTSAQSGTTISNVISVTAANAVVLNSIGYNANGSAYVTSSGQTAEAIQNSSSGDSTGASHTVNPSISSLTQAWSQNPFTSTWILGLINIQDISFVSAQPPMMPPVTPSLGRVTPSGLHTKRRFLQLFPQTITNQPVITNLQQYDGNTTSPVATGGLATTGVASGVNLEFDIRPKYEYWQTDKLDAKVEVQQIGNNLTDVATATALTTYYDPNEPIGFRGSAFAYDTLRKRFIMTFGANGSTSQNNVFELKFINGRAKWRTLATTGSAPLVRYQGGGVYDAVNDRFIAIFGFTTNDTNELWAINFSGSQEGVWQQLTSFTGVAPAIRSNVTQTCVNDPTNSCFYVFGGWGASFYNGVYKFDYSTANGTWSNLKADASASPAPVGVRNAVAVLDSNNGRIIVFGGNTNSTTGVVSVLSAFQINTTTWTTLSPAGTIPTARERHWGYFDTVNRRMVMGMGDDSNTANVKQEMYTLDLTSTNGTWARVDRAQDNTGQFVTGMYLCNAQWDPNQLMGVIWAGGVDVTADLQHHVLVVDSADTGSRVDLYGAMYNHFMRPMDATNTIYNPDALEAVAIGGFSQMTDNATPNNGGHVTDVFSYNYVNNLWRVATKGKKTFVHREGMSACYDTINKRCIAFGGLWGAGATNKGTFNDLWEIKRDTNGNYGVRRMAPTGTLPGARWLGNAIWDAARTRILLTCGSDGGSANFNDLWQLDLTSGDGAWTLLSPTGIAPTAKWAGAVANDTTNKIAYIFGGATSALDSTYTNQFHSLGYTNATPVWTSLNVTNAPTARRSLGMGWDGTNGKIIIFGGFDGTNVQKDINFYDIASTNWSGAATPAVSPPARRSHGSWYDPTNSRFMITHGRVASGDWYGDTWQLVPNYVTPANSVWTNLAPQHFIRASVNVTGLTASVNYHWQAWVVDNTVFFDSAHTSYGGNLESAIDFSTFSSFGINVDPSNAVYNKPNLKLLVF